MIGNFLLGFAACYFATASGFLFISRRDGEFPNDPFAAVLTALLWPLMFFDRGEA